MLAPALHNLTTKTWTRSSSMTSCSLRSKKKNTPESRTWARCIESMRRSSLRCRHCVGREQRLESPYLRGTSRHSRPGCGLRPLKPLQWIKPGGQTQQRLSPRSQWAIKQVPTRNNKPFSPVSPCKDRFHPGLLTISGRICLARTYPTLSFLGNASFNDSNLSMKYVSGGLALI